MTGITPEEGIGFSPQKHEKAMNKSDVDAAVVVFIAGGGEVTRLRYAG